MAADAQLNIVARLIDDVSGPMKGISSSFGGASSSFGSLTKSFVLGQVIFAGISKATELVSEGFHEAMTEASSMQASVSQINALLKTTHDASGESAESLQKMAESISETTPISKAAALAAEQMLIPFTNIHKNTFPKVMQAADDLATHLNHGLAPNTDQVAAAAKQLGRAFNDPASGMGLLKRAGVALTHDQQEQIKNMQKHGDLLGAQNTLLKDLSATMGGSAVAAGKTFSGQVQELKNRMIDLGAQGIIYVESQIMKLVNSPTFQKWMNTLTHVIIPALVGAIKEWIKWQVEVDSKIFNFVSHLTNWNKVFQALAGYFDDVRIAVEMFFKLLGGSDDPVPGETAKFNQLDLVMQLVILRTRQFIATVIDTAKVILKDLKQAFDFLWPSIASLVNTIVKDFLPAFLKLSEVVLSILIPVLKFLLPIIGVLLVLAFYVAINAINAFIQALSFLMNILSSVLRFIGSFVSGSIGLFRSLVSGIGSVIGGVFNVITAPFNAAYNVIKGIASAISGSFKGVGNVLHGLHIPGFATGVQNFGGGMALVGENGPELVNLPGRSSVYTASQSKGMMGGQSIETNIYGDIHLDSDSAVEAFFARIGRNQELAAKGLTPVRTI